MARKLLFERFGEEVYERGLNVTLTINSEYQVKANQAFRDGILAYDKRHGFKGPIGKIDLSQPQTEASQQKLLDEIATFPSSKDISPVVITETFETSI